MNDAVHQPELPIAIELRPPLASLVLDMARHYRETPQQTAERLLQAAILGIDMLEQLGRLLDLVAGPDDDRTECNGP
jgi:hypothetical protein